MMTDLRKQEIESLRKEGLSYRQIAEKVGVTPACMLWLLTLGKGAMGLI